MISNSSLKKKSYFKIMSLSWALFLLSTTILLHCLQQQWTMPTTEAINLNKTRGTNSPHIMCFFFNDDTDYLKTYLFIHYSQTNLVEHVKNQRVCKLLCKCRRCERVCFAGLRAQQETWECLCCVQMKKQEKIWLCWITYFSIIKKIVVSIFAIVKTTSGN